MQWRKDREDAWNFWIYDLLVAEIRNHMTGHRDHNESVELPSNEVLHALVDVAILLDITAWGSSDFGPELTNIPALVQSIADGIIGTFTKELEIPQ